MRELVFEKCEHFANILYATGYIRVTPEVSVYYSNPSQSLILLTVHTHPQYVGPPVRISEAASRLWLVLGESANIFLRKLLRKHHIAERRGHLRLVQTVKRRRPWSGECLNAPWLFAKPWDQLLPGWIGQRRRSIGIRECATT